MNCLINYEVQEIIELIEKILQQEKQKEQQ